MRQHAASQIGEKGGEGGDCPGTGGWLGYRHVLPSSFVDLNVVKMVAGG